MRISLLTLVVAITGSVSALPGLRRDDIPRSPVAGDVADTPPPPLPSAEGPSGTAPNLAQGVADLAGRHALDARQSKTNVSGRVTNFTSTPPFQVPAFNHTAATAAAVVASASSNTPVVKSLQQEVAEGGGVIAAPLLGHSCECDTTS